MFVRRQYDKVVIAVLLVIVFVYASFRPTFQVRKDMPGEFVDLGSGAALKRTSEEKIARAYWRCVVTDIQWKYHYGKRLPVEPPSNFSVDPKEVGPFGAAPATRARYWRKVQDVWFLPTAWTKDYEWDFGWMTGWARPVGQWILGHR